MLLDLHMKGHHKTGLRRCWSFLTLSILVVSLALRWKEDGALGLVMRTFQFCLALLVFSYPFGRSFSMSESSFSP